MTTFVGLSQLLSAECGMCGRRSLTLCQCPCKRAFYCDVACQRRHWAVHKLTCTKAQRHTNTRLTRCASCGTLSNVLMICACGTVYYCSLDCQRQHFVVHRRSCAFEAARLSKPLTGGALSGLGGAGADVGGATNETAVGSTQTAESCDDLLARMNASRMQREAEARAQFARPPVPHPGASGGRRVSAAAAARAVVAGANMGAESTSPTARAAGTVGVGAGAGAQEGVASPMRVAANDRDDDVDGISNGDRTPRASQQQEQVAIASPATASDSGCSPAMPVMSSPPTNLTHRKASFVMPDETEAASVRAATDESPPPSAK